MGWSKLTDMELDDEDQMDSVMPIATSKPRFPWGLRISLTHKELEKLGLDADCDIGDMIDMRCFATVTSVSKNDSESCRVELQIEKMSVENEMDESEDD
jgi:hypothetical protein